MTQIIQYHCDRCKLVENKQNDLAWCAIRVSPSGVPQPGGRAGRKLELCPSCEAAFERFLKADAEVVPLQQRGPR